MHELPSKGQIVKLDLMSGERTSKFIGLKVVRIENQECVCLKNKIGI